MKVYNNLFNDIPCEYFYWSRIANLKYTIKNSRADFLKRIVTHRAMGTLKLSIGSVLKSISLESLIDQLNQYDLDSDMELNEENKENFENFLIDHIDKIQNIYDEEKMQLIEKINKTIGNAKKIAVIDVGWVGSGPLGLKYLIETEMNMDCIVYCWLAASRSIPGEENIYMLTNNTLETYIFSRNYNRNNYDVHSKTNKNINNIPFEIFTQACHPTFFGFFTNGDYKFGIPEVENYAFIEEVHKGIIDFYNRYKELSSTEPSLLNISGYDAYLPFRFIIRDLRFIKKYFYDFYFSRNINGDIENQRMESLGEIMEDIGI